jgi:hypothetical protein
LFFGPANVFIIIILELLMTFVIITVSRLLAPGIKEIPDKFTTHECGERPVGSAWHTYGYGRPCSTVVTVKRYSFLGMPLFELCPAGKRLKNMKLTGVRSLAIIPSGLLDFCEICHLG